MIITLSSNSEAALRNYLTDEGLCYDCSINVSSYSEAALRNYLNDEGLCYDCSIISSRAFM